MSLAERGLYIEALLVQWRLGYIPDDAKLLARAIGCDSREIRYAWPKVRKQFVPLEADQAAKLGVSSTANRGLIVNKRLRDEFEKRAKISQVASESVKRRYEGTTHARARSESVSLSPVVVITTPEGNEGKGGVGGKVFSEVPAWGSEGPDDWAERLYAAHPRKKGKPLVEQAVARIWQRDASRLPEIARVHLLWVRSMRWTEEGGRFAPALAEWLADEGWTAEPRNEAPKTAFEKLMDSI